jgi:hypothetical protein
VSDTRFKIGWYNGWSPAERLATVPIQREAVRSGALPRPTRCSVCGARHVFGSSNPVWLHDENYADPLAAFPICRSCHRTLHERFVYPEPWRALVTAHATGSSWFEQLSMDPASLYQRFEVTYPDGLPSA